MITVTFLPDARTETFPKIRTALQLLEKLQLRINDALVIRDGELLTPDRRIEDGDSIAIRMVQSRG